MLVHVAVAAAVAFAAVAYVTSLRPVPPSRTPVVVDAMSVGDRDGRRLEVTVTVVNKHHERKAARVWWLLAVPGRGPEWDRRAYRSSVRSLELAPGEKADLAWDQDAPVPPGLYAVSAWVHVEGANGFNHEDGHLGPAIVVGADVDGQGVARVAAESLLRAGPPRFGVGIEQVVAPTEQPAETGGSPAATSGAGPVTVIVRNPTEQIHRTMVRWGVFPVAEKVPSDWWRLSSAWWGAPVAVDLGPGESREVALGDVGVAEPGRYGLRVLLDTTAREAGGPLDDVAVASPLLLGPPQP